MKVVINKDLTVEVGYEDLYLGGQVVVQSVVKGITQQSEDLVKLTAYKLGAQIRNLDSYHTANELFDNFPKLKRVIREYNKSVHGVNQVIVVDYSAPFTLRNLEGRRIDLRETRFKVLIDSDRLLSVPLNNVFNDGGICSGQVRLVDKDAPVAEAFAGVMTKFFNSNFNTDLGSFESNSAIRNIELTFPEDFLQERAEELSGYTDETITVGSLENFLNHARGCSTFTIDRYLAVCSVLGLDLTYFF